VLAAAFFIYRAARRQVYLLKKVYEGHDEQRPYERDWPEIRVTFWALDIVLLFLLFLLMS
jgi:hypothetical protein